MSYTKGELVSAALEEIGIASYEFDIQPEQVESGLRRLDSMLAEWNAKGIHLSYPIAKLENSFPTDDSYIPDSAWEAVITNLAIRLAPSYGKTVSSETRISAKGSFNTLCKTFASPRERQLNSMPKGAGYKDTGSTFTSSPVEQYLEPVDEDVDTSGGPV